MEQKTGILNLGIDMHAYRTLLVFGKLLFDSPSLEKYREFTVMNYPTDPAVWYLSLHSKWESGDA